MKTSVNDHAEAEHQNDHLLHRIADDQVYNDRLQRSQKTAGSSRPADGAFRPAVAASTAPEGQERASAEASGRKRRLLLPTEGSPLRRC